MTSSVSFSEAVNVKESQAEAERLRQVLLETPTDNPALRRLRLKVEGGTADAGVLTDYSRMHHRHNRD